MHAKALLLTAALAVPAVGCATTPAAAEGRAPEPARATPAGWTSFVSADRVAELAGREGVVIVDVRKPDEYAAGHIPGAINLPGGDLRTASAEPGEGDSQYLFRTADGALDVGRYEQLLGAAGIDEGDTVVVYGNHAGKGDGSIPAMILDILGHDDVLFLDGVGLSEWVATGRPTETAPNNLPAEDYVAADADPAVIWDLDEVLAHVGDDSVVFLDTRSPAEYAGDEATLTERGNARGGHIPGAVLLDYADQLDPDKRTLAPEQIAAQFAERGVDPDDTVVLYCQTATRVSLPYLALKDLGYEDVRVYDASWHEYGNRADTPIEK